MRCVIKKNRQWTEYINNFNSEMYLTLWKRKQLNEKLLESRRKCRELTPNNSDTHQTADLQNKYTPLTTTSCTFITIYNNNIQYV